MDKLLKQANNAFKKKDYEKSYKLYQKFALEKPELKHIVTINLQQIEKKLEKLPKIDFKSINDKKIIIYTVNVSNYESVKEPLVVDPNVEYILFTDDKNLKSEHWKVIYLEDNLADPRRKSRLPKILAHKYLPPHDISVYIDSSLQIKAPDIKKMIDECMEGNDIALYKHYKRDCVYDEIEFVMNSKDRIVKNREKCKAALKMYKDINYPKHNGLFENAFIFRKNTKKIQELNELWWKEYEKGTERDQFVLMYVLWKKNIKVKAITEGKQFRDNAYVNFYKHQYKSNTENINLLRLSTVNVDNTDQRLKRILNSISKKSTKVVSFDIFDTLLIRNVFDPKDIFLLMAKDNFVKEIFEFYDFSEARIEAENFARKTRSSDPTLNDIYKILQKNFNLKNETMTSLMELELEYEAKFLYKHSAVKYLYDYALSLGKEVIIVSDMYLPFSFIEDQLSAHGFTNYKKLFLSSDCGYTKKHGTIYPFICQELKVHPQEILHIGDNLKSDIKEAEKKGLIALRVFDVRKRFFESVQNDLVGCFPKYKSRSEILFLSTRLNLALLLRKKFTSSLDNKVLINSSNQLGYSILGPFLLSLILRIRRKSVELGLTDFLWLARDGYLPMRANEILDQHIGNVFTSQYLPISRKMLFPFYTKTMIGIRQIFTIPYQDDFLVKNFVEQRFGDIGIEILRSNVDNKFDDLMEQYMFEQHDYIYNLFSKNFLKIKNSFSESYKHLNSFYESIINDGQTYGLFDVGRKGTFQKVLSRKYNVNIKGFYVVNNSKIEDNVENSYENFLPVIDKMVHLNNPDTIIYELLLSDIKGSYKGVIDNRLIREKEDVGEKEKLFIEEIQNGALEFIVDAVALHGKDVKYLEQQPIHASYGMENAFKNENVKLLFSNIPHYDNMSTNLPRTLLDVFEKKAKSNKYLMFPVKTKLKRIVIYSPAITRIRGGAERVASRIANHFNRLNYEVLLISSANPTASTKTVYEVHPAIYVRNIKVDNPESIAELVNSFKADCALVLASGSVLINIVKGLKISKIPFMLSERADPAIALETYWKNYSYNDYNNIYSQADIISVQFDSFKKFFNKKNQKKIVTLANPFKLPKFDLDVTREKVIVCAARIWFNQKRQDILLKAFAKISKNFPDWRLEFYGNAYGDDANILTKMSIELNIKDKVKISPSIENIQTIFKNSSMFVLPSRFEGFPNSLAEAMSYGLPSIGFNTCPGVNELIKDNNNGYLIEFNNEKDAVKNLATYMSKLMSNTHLRKQFGENAIEYMKKYSDENVMVDWEKQIEYLIDSKNKWRIKG